MTPIERLQFNTHDQIQWTHALTVRTNQVTDSQLVYRFLNKQIMRSLRKHYGSLICGYGVLNYLKGSHCHILIRAEDPKVLADLNTVKLVEILKEAKCSLGFHANAVDVQPITDNNGALRYVHSNYPERSGKGAWLYFGRRLLDALYRAYPIPIANNPCT